jgi:integral membrane protein
MDAGKKSYRVVPMTEPTSTGALTRFRLLAVLCGVNLLLLVLVFMPAKYIFKSLEENGWIILIPITHGYLYIVYILTVLQIGVQKRMKFVTIIALIAAGTLPVASFIAERKITKKYAAVR